MSVGEDDFDRLAHALVEVEYDFDAVEWNGLRASWDDEGNRVVVEDPETGESQAYLGDDLVIATSDREVRKARQEPEAG